MLPGNLFCYGPNELVAFCASTTREPRSKDKGNSKAIVAILVSGLTNGIYNLPYTDALVGPLGNMGVELIMPVLRTSWYGWGMGSLAGDAEDLTDLIDELRKEKSQSLISFVTLLFLLSYMAVIPISLNIFLQID